MMPKRNPRNFARALMSGAAALSVAVGTLEAVGSAAAPPIATTSPGAIRQRAEERLESLREKYNPGYRYEIDDDVKLILVVSDADPAVLEAVHGRLAAHAKALDADLFAHPLRDYVTVVIPRHWHGSGQGFFNPAEKSIVAKTSGVQLVHEFTHALHFADQEARGQQHQNWVIEGLATLYESSIIVDGHAIPQPNYRLKIIQNLARSNRSITWADYVKYDQKQFMKQPANHYSQARYMFMYLYQTQNLKKWYDAYVTGFSEDSTGAMAFEKVYAKPLSEIENDWTQWLLSLPLLTEAPVAKPGPPAVP